ncbi:MAG TPA: hypothetical protein VGP30_04465, partial [Candidatus Limnocylindrales bacterium]|nr:hypothetical protein [Candidatus Limnocylindrales bacterium]
VLEGLCRDLHLLRSLNLTPSAPEPSEEDEVWTGAMVIGGVQFPAVFRRRDREAGAPRVYLADMDDAELGAQAAAQVATPLELPKGPVTMDPAPSVSARHLAGLKAGDRRNFRWAFIVATIVYFVTIYSATYGSLIDYLTAFGAGAGSTYLANFKLLPWFRSYRPVRT